MKKDSAFRNTGSIISCTILISLFNISKGAAFLHQDIANSSLSLVHANIVNRRSVKISCESKIASVSIVMKSFVRRPDRNGKRSQPSTKH